MVKAFIHLNVRLTDIPRYICARVINPPRLFAVQYCFIFAAAALFQEAIIN